MQPMGLDGRLLIVLRLLLLPSFVYERSEGSGETAHTRRLSWAFTVRQCDKHELQDTTLPAKLGVLLRHTEKSKYIVYIPLFCHKDQPYFLKQNLQLAKSFSKFSLNILFMKAYMIGLATLYAKYM